MKNSSLWIVLQRMRVPFIVIIITYTISIIGFLLIDGVDDKGNPYSMTIFDAFYFITYSATTIGFGEVPYTFTYTQRIWATISIYLTVLGWFYGVGTLVSLLQDKLFLNEISKARFRRQIKRFKRKFIIVLGYNNITSEIIKRILDSGMRVVVIEKNQERANDLILESYTPFVPVMVADAHDPVALESAGIKKTNCKALVSLFEDDTLNLRVAITSKILNRSVKLAVKSTTHNHSENLRDAGADIIENPFIIIADQIEMALRAPGILRLEKWIYKINTLDQYSQPFPRGKYIVCGFGRMGRNIYNVLENQGVDSSFIEIDSRAALRLSNNEREHLQLGDGDDKDRLIEVGAKEACAIIAGTNNDTVNLSILATAKKINPNIMTIARENELEDFSIFSNAKIDHIFMPSKLLIHKTANALISPLSDIFARAIIRQDEKWAQALLTRLMKDVNTDPELFEIKIDNEEACEVHRRLEAGEELALRIFWASRHNRAHHNNVVPLLILRGEEEILLPKWDMKLEMDDHILFACDENAIEDMEYIAQNINELHYILTGEEKKFIWRRE